MAQTYLPTAQVNAGIAAIFPTAGTYWLALNTASPALTGANEASGGSYARQSLTIGAASLGVELSTNAPNFTSMPSVTVDWFAIWTLVTAGTYDGGGQLTSSLTVPVGATVAFAVGALSLTFSG